MPYTIVPERRGLGLQSSGGVERGGGFSGAVERGDGGGGGFSGAAKHSDRSIVHWQKKQQRHQVSPARRTAAESCASKQILVQKFPMKH